MQRLAWSVLPLLIVSSAVAQETYTVCPEGCDHTDVQSAVDGSHGSMQLSGAQMTWRMKMGVPEAVSITVGDAPLDPGAIYTVATNTYVVDQAEKYLPGADPKNVVEKGMTVFDAALGAVKEGPVSVDSVFRLQQVE